MQSVNSGSRFVLFLDKKYLSQTHHISKCCCKCVSRDKSDEINNCVHMLIHDCSVIQAFQNAFAKLCKCLLVHIAHFKDRSAVLCKDSDKLTMKN